ncbi:MAG TPA: phosphotransferase family protein [Acidimicrobiales bacterium]|nr:phosphotransferase family protein [Acidimicrobiales bacterium]
MAIDGINEENVTAWLEANVEGVAPPLTFALIAGGHSNLTFGVTDAKGSKYVLRRPPLGHVLATAHDMQREHTIISALGPTPVPVAPALGLCMDHDVNGAPFYVMGFVDGNVIRDAEAARTLLDEEGRRVASESVADVMADIHAVDVDAVGLGALGKKEGYIARQLKRWYTQFQGSQELTERPVPLVHEVHDTLAARIPPQDGATIVHGDYRLDNCMLGYDHRIAAVLDWEICTLGDPLADVGLLMVYWNEATDEHATLITTAATAVPGFALRADLLERYAKTSGRDLSDIDFYVAFGYWKLACIVEGVYARYAHGAMGTPTTGFEAFATQTVRLADAAKAAVDKFA